MTLNMFPRLSLKTRVTLFTLAIFLFGVWLLVFYASRVLRTDMQRLLGDQQFSTATIVAGQINDELHNRMNALETFAVQKITPAILGNAATMQTSLEESPTLQGMFNGGVWTTRQDGIVIASVPPARIGTNFSDREYMIAALTEGKSTISKPIIGRVSKAPNFVMAAPIRDTQGKVIGVLVGVIELDKPSFLDTIAQRRYGKTGGFVLVAPQHGLIVTATDKRRIMTPTAGSSADPLVARFIQGYEGSGVLVNPLGEEMLSSAKGIPAAGWYLVANTPTAEAFAPIYAIQLHVLIATILLTLLAGCLTWWMLRRQLSPMLAAAKTLASLSDTNQPFQPLPITSQDEIGELIGGFNRLLENLAQREVALRVSEERSRAMTHSAHDAVITSDRTGTVVGWNPGAQTIFGYPESEVMGQPLTLLMPERYYDGHCAGMSRILSGGEYHIIGQTVELNGLRKDGSEFPLEISLAKWETTDALFITAIIRDITERKQREKAQHAAEEQFRGLVEQSIAGIYIIVDEKLAYVNPRFAEIFGYDSADEPIGHDALSVVAENERAAVEENIRTWLKGGTRSISYSTTALRKDGSTLVVGVHGTRATYRDRPAIVGMLQDISEKKRAEEEIQRYVEQLKTAFMSTVEVATTLSEMRDPYTAGHERRVAAIAVAIGAELGFDAHRQEGLQVAGHLHDIGKITIPSEILSKPGKLSPIEFRLIQGHAQASFDVLKAVEFPWPVAQVALQHHERIDGSGYPQGLKGEAILLEARIMAVADIVEAMASHRPYRAGLGLDKALAEIERGRGTAYDADAANACLRLFREKAYQLPP